MISVLTPYGRLDQLQYQEKENLIISSDFIFCAQIDFSFHLKRYKKKL